jgi:hypothetical protein
MVETNITKYKENLKIVCGKIIGDVDKMNFSKGTNLILHLFNFSKTSLME